MQDMKFLIVGDKGPINHGTIIEAITAEKYLCEFNRLPFVCLICDLEEIQGWFLFPNDEAMNAYILDLRKKNPPPNTIPNGMTPPDKAPSGGPKPNKKKKPVKKKAKKKAKKKVKSNAG